MEEKDYKKYIRKAYKMLKKGQYRRAEKLLYILRDLNWGSFIVHKMYHFFTLFTRL